MRRISITRSKAGMRLAKPILNDYGTILINKDIELTELMIQRLKIIGVDSLYIQDTRTEDLQIEDVLSDKTRELAMKTIKVTFQDLFKEKLMHHSLAKGNLSKVFRPVLENILEDMKKNKNVVLMLTDIYIRDLYLYSHSLNVAMYSIALGMAKGYDTEKLLDLGIGALLHDIGKTKIPIELLEKKGTLTSEEMALLKEHSRYGYEILRKEEGISMLSAHCALQHHERLDGQGYPRGINGEQIHDYAKIVAITDVYDALISHRIYKERILPHKALDYLFSKAGKDFDHHWLGIFRESIALYPIGTTVTLSTGESGVVIDINANYPDRPIIRVLETNEDGELHSPYEVDLSKHLSNMIIYSSPF